MYKIVHRDLKPNNILFRYKNQNDLRIKILDFGFAFFYDEEEAKNGKLDHIGTPIYIAPEILNR